VVAPILGGAECGLVPYFESGADCGLVVLNDGTMVLSAWNIQRNISIKGISFNYKIFRRH